MEIEQDSPRVRFPPPLVFVGVLLIGLGAERFLQLRNFGLDQVTSIGFGVALVLVGFAIGLAAVRSFNQAGTRPEPWRASTGIVESGLYRWSRNPMYLGMALAYAGFALAFDGPIALILLPVPLLVVRTQVIAREERYLEAKFGSAYLDYKRRVRRWL